MSGTGGPVTVDGYDLVIADLDGVVYLGGTPISGAPEALQEVKRAGAHVAYVTNNASRTPAAVAALLDGMGAPVTEADVVTSAQAAARLLADKLPPGSKVLVIGGTALRLAVRERGLVPVSTATEKPAAVVQGFAPGIDYGRLAEGGLAVRSGALFVATNADSTIPNARGTAPGNGSLLKVIENATGTAPVVAGKPEPPLHRESVIRTGARRPLVIGDRLDTDIEAAYNTGTDSLLVLTGVDNARTVTLAPVHHRPTYIAETLDALLRPYRITVVLYEILFFVGVAFFVLAAYLGLRDGQSVVAIAFAGLSTASFLAFFVRQPVRALEENLEFISWLGVAFNTYWTRLMYLSDKESVQADLKAATDEYCQMVQTLIDKHAALAGKRTAGK